MDSLLAGVDKEATMATFYRYMAVICFLVGLVLACNESDWYFINVVGIIIFCGTLLFAHLSNKHGGL